VQVHTIKNLVAKKKGRGKRKGVFIFPGGEGKGNLGGVAHLLGRKGRKERPFSGKKRERKSLKVLIASVGDSKKRGEKGKSRPSLSVRLKEEEKKKEKNNSKKRPLSLTRKKKEKRKKKPSYFRLSMGKTINTSTEKRKGKEGNRPIPLILLQ